MLAGTLEIQLLTNLARLRDDMNQAKNVVSGAMSDIQRTVEKTKDALGALGIGFSITAVVSYVKGLVEMGEQMLLLSERTGIAVEDLSAFAFAAKLGNVEVESFTRALDIFNKNLVLATNSTSKMGRLFTELGVDISRGPAEAFRQFARNASNIEDASVKAAVFREVFGRAGAALIPVAANLDDTTKAAERLGIVMDENTAKAAERLEKNLKTLKAQSDLLALKFLSPAVEGLNSMAEAILKGSERSERWSTALREVVNLAAAALGAAGSRGGVLDTIAENAFIASLPQGGRTAVGRIRQAAPPPPDQDPAKLAKILAEKEGLEKREIAAVQQLEEKRKALFPITETQIIQERLLGGTYKDFEPVYAKRLLGLAREIDLRQLILAALRDEVAGHDANNEARAKVSEFKSGREQLLQDQEFELSLIGKTTVEVEKLTAARKFDMDARAKAADIDPERFPEQNAEIFALTDTFKRRWSASYDAVRAKSREWQTGTNAAFNDYIDHATNAAEQAAFVFGNAFRSMEDMLVNWVMTGKLNFKEFANSVISDIVRIQVRQAIAFGAASLGGTGGFLAGIFGSGAAAADPSSFVGHTGGVVGRDIFTRGTDAPSSMLAMIPRYHRGLASDERLGVFQTGETVLPRGMSPGMQVHIHQAIHVGGNVTEADIPMIISASRQASMNGVAEVMGRFPNGPYR